MIHATMIHVTDHVRLSLIQVLLVVDLILKLSAVDCLQVRMPNCGLGEMNLRATYQKYQWLLVKVSKRHVRRLLMMRCSCIGLQREYPQLSLKVWKVIACVLWWFWALKSSICYALFFFYSVLLINAILCYNYNHVLPDDVVGGKQDYPRRIAKVLTEGLKLFIRSTRTIFDTNVINMSHLLLLVIEALTTCESIVARYLLFLLIIIHHRYVINWKILSQNSK